MIALQSYYPLHYGVLSSDDISYLYAMIAKNLLDCNMIFKLQRKQYYF